MKPTTTLYSFLLLYSFLNICFGQYVCPLSGSQPPSPQPTIAVCPQYRNFSCCLPFSDSELGNNTSSQVAPLYGTGNCYTNIKNLFCAWLCSPLQFNLTSTVASGYNPNIINVTVYVDPTWANAFFTSCSKVCLPFGGGREVQQQYAGGSDFVTSFSSSNDPTYVPDITHPNLIYSTNPSPNGAVINSAIIPLFTDASTGCPIPVAKKNSGTSLLFDAFLLLFILASI